VKGTWLENVDRAYVSEKVDAYLYLGSRDSLLRGGPGKSQSEHDWAYAAAYTVEALERDEVPKHLPVIGRRRDPELARGDVNRQTL
jgi:hypothetical protein